ncbi:hypothetical protein KAR91_18350 [Candidatus Pacearchaeota archaeon]|nr:hypothetical protein [Candidatus Pacearchaeota archaeon]
MNEMISKYGVGQRLYYKHKDKVTYLTVVAIMATEGEFFYLTKKLMIREDDLFETKDEAEKADEAVII